MEDLHEIEVELSYSDRERDSSVDSFYSIGSYDDMFIVRQKTIGLLAQTIKSPLKLTYHKNLKLAHEDTDIKHISNLKPKKRKSMKKKKFIVK
jgi:hypothetical protein